MAEIPVEDEPRIMAVRDYALRRGLQPQIIHYYIRKRKLLPDYCECGRTCVNVEEADEFFRRKAKKDVQP